MKNLGFIYNNSVPLYSLQSLNFIHHSIKRGDNYIFVGKCIHVIDTRFSMEHRHSECIRLLVRIFRKMTTLKCFSISDSHPDSITETGQTTSVGNFPEGGVLISIKQSI